MGIFDGNPQDSGIGASQTGSDPWMRNMMLAQMLMRSGQQPQGQGWAGLAGAGGNIVQAMMLRRMLDQGQQAQPNAVTPHPPTPLQSPGMGQTTPFPSQPSFAAPPQSLGLTGQMPGTTLGNPTFPGGIAPFGTSGTGGIY